MKNVISRFDIGFLAGVVLTITIYVGLDKLPLWVVIPSWLILWGVLRFLSGRVKK